MNNVVWQHAAVGREDREKRQGHRGLVVWFTGLSGSGKSTISTAVDKALFDAGKQTVLLDGDNVRHGLCSDLGFSAADRSENLRRVAEVAKLFAGAGHIVLAAFIAPLHDDRASIKAIVGADDWVEVFVDCTLSVCEQRDVKGMYKKARAGEIRDFTGISAPYEAPYTPDLRLQTDQVALAQCVEQVLTLVNQRSV